MRLFRIFVREHSGYDCNGHSCTYFVAANTPEEAKEFFQQYLNDDELEEIKEVILPDFKRLKKPRLI